MIIKGNAVGGIRPNWNQTDPEKADYILGKDVVEKAIEDTQKAVEDAKTAAEDAQKAIEDTQKAVEDTQKAVEDAQTAAEDAQTAAEDAQKTADSKADLLTASVTLSASGWSNNVQTVNVAGVTADKEKCHVVPCTPDSVNNELYYNSGVCCEAQLDGKLTFSCKETPGTDIIVNLLILIKGVTS